MATFGEILTRAMAGRQMTQATLTRESGVPQPVISQIIHRGRQPRVQHLTALERVMPELIDMRHRGAA